MKLALFPSASAAARPVVALSVPSTGKDGEGFPSGTFVHIREDRTSSVLPVVLLPETHEWLREHTMDALQVLGCVMLCLC